MDRLLELSIASHLGVFATQGVVGPALIPAPVGKGAKSAFMCLTCQQLLVIILNCMVRFFTLNFI